MSEFFFFFNNNSRNVWEIFTQFIIVRFYGPVLTSISLHTNIFVSRNTTERLLLSACSFKSKLLLLLLRAACGKMF